MVIRNIEFRKNSHSNPPNSPTTFFREGGVRILFCALRLYCSEAIAAARAPFGALAQTVADAGDGAGRRAARGRYTMARGRYTIGTRWAHLYRGF